MTAMVEQQYLQLYRENEETVQKHAPRALNEPRELAYQTLAQKGFPKKGEEDYQRSDIEGAFDFDFGININRFLFPVKQKSAFQCNIPGLNTDLCYVLNDAYDKDLSSTGELPEGAFIGGLSEFAMLYPELAAKYYAKLAKPDHDALVAFNTLFAQDGFVIYLPKETILERPIQLVQLLRADVPLLANRRMLIILEENSSASMLVCEHSLDVHQFLATQVIEIFAAEGSKFALYELEESSRNTKRLSSMHVKQEASSEVILNGMTIHNGYTRNNYWVDLAGQEASLTLAGVAIASQKQHVDNYSRIEHNVPNCHSNELFKYVIDDDAQGAFSGRIYVKQDAQKTAAYQSNRNLLLSASAKMYSKPQLEIYADDVKCSHGMTTGQLDEEALFYLRQRGISREEAKLMLSIAFAEDVLQLVHLDELRERLRNIIEHRFRGSQIHCGSCNACY